MANNIPYRVWVTVKCPYCGEGVSDNFIPAGESSIATSFVSGCDKCEKAFVIEALSVVCKTRRLDGK